MGKPLLSVRNLKTYFFIRRGILKAVDDICIYVNKGEKVGLVGESGCGKTVTALSIMRLVPNPPGKIVEGEIWLGDKDILQVNESEMMNIRGSKVAMIFQDPLTFLNPSMRVGDQIVEAIMLNQDVGKQEAFEKTVEIMRAVEIPQSRSRAKSYPHQLSGGMRQRCLLAMALSCNPDLLVADEPTTSVDVLTQRKILDLLDDWLIRSNSSILLITHDLGLVAHFTEKVFVMYAGNILEAAETTALFKNPLSPYTNALLKSLPSPKKLDRRLATISGVIPDLVNPPSGCKFHLRCPYATEICRRQRPPLKEIDANHRVACWLYEQ